MPGQHILEELTSTPANPSSGDLKVYAKTDDALYILDSAGNEYSLGDSQTARTLSEADTGTVTASGGSTPAVDTTVANVALAETDRFRPPSFYVDADPGFNADYAWNAEWGFQWDDTNQEVDLNITINWDTDPGAGNDVTIRWDVLTY